MAALGCKYCTYFYVYMLLEVACGIKPNSSAIRKQEHCYRLGFESDKLLNPELEIKLHNCNLYYGPLSLSLSLSLLFFNFFFLALIHYFLNQMRLLAHQLNIRQNGGGICKDVCLSKIYFPESHPNLSGSSQKM